jgi:hypothetical protein
VQGSGYNACTGKYCIICPGGTKKVNKSLNGKNKNYFSVHSLIVVENLQNITSSEKILKPFFTRRYHEQYC